MQKELALCGVKGALWQKVISGKYGEENGG